LDDESESFGHAAARELFEETGLLVKDWDALVPSADRAQLRRDLLSEQESPAWQALLRPQPDPPALHRLGAMRTPAFAPVRYHTEFFLYRVGADARAEILPGELSQGEFVDPEEALEQWRRGERLIVPPVRTLLEMFVAWGPDRFLAEVPERLAQYLAGRIPPIANSPGVCLVPLRTPTIPPATTTNHYLVGERELYLVDPGTPYASEQGALIGFLEERIALGSKLRGILLTHQHHDHVGGLEAIERHFQVPVHAHPHTLAELAGRIQTPLPLNDGDRIDLGVAPDGSEDWHLKVVHTPGHAAGHLVFHESRYGTLIGGDLASTVSTIVIEPPEGHLATYLASLRKAIELGPTLFYPAHGPVARDGVALLRGYLTHRALREARLAEALRKGGVWSPGALVPEVYPELDARMAGLAEQSLWAGLIKLQEEGLAQLGELGWSWRGSLPAPG